MEAEKERLADEKESRGFDKLYLQMSEEQEQDNIMVEAKLDHWVQQTREKLRAEIRDNWKRMNENELKFCNQDDSGGKTNLWDTQNIAQLKQANEPLM